MPAVFLLLLFCLSPLAAQHSDADLKNPFQSPDDRTRGGAFFQSQCANCHGIDGKGGASGPNLTGNFRHASNDEGLFRLITKGVPGTSMPGFSMNGREIWQIVAHIRSLSAYRSAANSTGNPQTGQQLFQSNRCLNCHWLNGVGAPRGLDLSAIGARLNSADLLVALNDPSADVASEFWAWQATTKTGATLRGQRLNEDTFSLQILDQAGRLRSVAKADLKSQSLDHRSPMPSFREKLTDAQRNDLIAYLTTLQGAAQ